MEKFTVGSCGRTVQVTLCLLFSLCYASDSLDGLCMIIFLTLIAKCLCCDRIHFSNIPAVTDGYWFSLLMRIVLGRNPDVSAYVTCLLFSVLKNGKTNDGYGSRSDTNAIAALQVAVAVVGAQHCLSQALFLLLCVLGIRCILRCGLIRIEKWKTPPC